VELDVGPVVAEVADVDVAADVRVRASAAQDGERVLRRAVGAQPPIPLGEDGSARQKDLRTEQCRRLLGEVGSEAGDEGDHDLVATDPRAFLGSLPSVERVRERDPVTADGRAVEREIAQWLVTVRRAFLKQAERLRALDRRSR